MGRANRDWFYFNWVLSTSRPSHCLYSLTLCSCHCLPPCHAFSHFNGHDMSRLSRNLGGGDRERCFCLWWGHLQATWCAWRPQATFYPAWDWASAVCCFGHQANWPQLLRILMSLPPSSSYGCCNCRCSLACLAFHGFCGFKIKVLTFGWQDLYSVSQLSCPMSMFFTNKHLNTCLLPTESQATTDRSPSHRCIVCPLAHQGYLSEKFSPVTPGPL